MRLIEPCSKLRSIALLQEYFGIAYTRDCVYEWLPKISLIKDEVESIAVAYAKKHLGFDFSLVFYDVTTLYFETFRKDKDEVENEQNILAQKVSRQKTGETIKTLREKYTAVIVPSKKASEPDMIVGGQKLLNQCGIPL